MIIIDRITFYLSGSPLSLSGDHQIIADSRFGTIQIIYGINSGTGSVSLRYRSGLDIKTVTGVHNITLLIIQPGSVIFSTGLAVSYIRLQAHIISNSYITVDRITAIMQDRISIATVIFNNH